MSFARPEILPWLWVLLVLPLLYLARRRPRPAAVPHLFLWERVLRRDGRARRNRIRDLVGLLLQVVVGAALVFAWAGPQREDEVAVRGRLVVALDTSETMGARDAAGRSRIDAAREAVRGRLRSWVGERDVALYELGDGLALLQPPTGDLERLEAALDGLDARPGGRADRDLARSWLEGLAALGDPPGIVIVGDGIGLGEVAEAPEIARVGVGETAPNAGLVSAALIEADDGRCVGLRVGLAARGGAARGRIRVEQDGLDAPALLPFRLDEDEDAVLDVPAELRRDAFARVRLESDGGDAWEADDALDLFVPESVRLRVLVVAERVDPSLRAALGVLEGTIDPEAAREARPAAWREAAPLFDVVVLQGVEEERPLPPGRYLLIDSWAPGLPLERGEPVEGVDAVRQTPGGLALRGFDLRNLRMERARRIVAGPGARVLVEGTSGALITEGAAGETVFVHLAFGIDPASSSFAFLDGFPLFLKDALRHLSPQTRRFAPPVLAAGEPFRPAPEPGRAAPAPAFFLLLGDDGEVRDRFEPEALAEGGVRVPERPGPYRLVLGEGEEEVGVARLGAGRVDLRPRWDPGESGAGLPALERRRVPRDLTWIALALALGVLVLEWWLHHRGWTS